jgi:hypothetical protein
MDKPILRQLLFVGEIDNHLLRFGAILQVNVSKFDSPQQSRVRVCPDSDYPWSSGLWVLPGSMQVAPRSPLSLLDRNGAKILDLVAFSDLLQRSAEIKRKQVGQILRNRDPERLSVAAH